VCVGGFISKFLLGWKCFVIKKVGERTVDV
jgi:hypothetical protein